MGAQVMADDEDDYDDGGVFCFEILEGDHMELLKFLKASAVWMSSLPGPPSRDEFKLFLEGGWTSSNISKFTTCGREASLPPECEEVGTTIKGMALAVEEFIENNEMT